MVGMRHPLGLWAKCLQAGLQAVGKSARQPAGTHESRLLIDEYVSIYLLSLHGAVIVIVIVDADVDVDASSAT